MFSMQIKNISFILFTVMLISIAGCSDDETQYNLAGHWEGLNTNQTTDQSWAFKLFVEHRGSDLNGYYSDYRGDVTLRSIIYDDESISFVIDLWPDTVTFFGTVATEKSMSGSWSYSGDGNNGSWYLSKDSDPEEDEEEQEDDTENSTANPFAQ